VLQALQADPTLAAIVECLARGQRIEQIILFGSRARDDWEELSDYDLLVIVPDAGYYRGLAVDLRRELAAIPVAKDLVVAARSTMLKQADIPGTIYYEAAHEGLTLYAAA
jgi:predicted nucleotidyltransferase